MLAVSALALRFDTLYKKDVQAFRIEKGSRKELHYRIPYGSAVSIRVSATSPVILNMAGPHMEQIKFSGVKEFKFTVDPGTDLYISFQGESGFFAKPSDITLEIELYTAKDAIEIGEEINNLLDVLNELGKDYYDLNKEHVKDVLRKIAKVWKILDSDTKKKAKELMELAKKFEEGS